MNEKEKYRIAERMAKNELCKSMCLCPSIRAADSCDECGVFSSLRDYYMTLVFDEESVDTLNDYSWDEIAEIAECGRAAEKFDIGDEKTATLYTGEEVTFVIVGFDHDYVKRYGGSKAGITFALKNVLDGRFEMSAEYTNKGGWRSIKMRSEYMERFMSLLPQELRNNIKPVVKMTGIGDRSDSTETTVEDLFLFSVTEVFGLDEHEKDEFGVKIDGPDDYAPCEGRRYPYFIKKENRICYKNGDEIYWWLRSPFIQDDKFFCHVYQGGELGCSGPQCPYGVRFGFCL